MFIKYISDFMKYRVFKKKGNKELVYDTTKECISGPV